MRKLTLPTMILVLIPVVALALFLTQQGYAKGVVVAKVNGVEISESDMKMAETEMFNQLVNVPKSARRKVLIEYLIETQLLSSAGEKAKVSDQPNYSQRTAYYQRRALRDAYFNSQVFAKVKEADARKTYDEAAKEIELHARHILVKEESLAKELHKKLTEGGDFAALAKEYSLDPGSKVKGGDLGFFAKGQMVPSFEQAAFALKKKGEISEPVKSRFGWHIIQYVEQRSRKLPPFDGVKQRIIEVLWQQKAQEMIEGLRKSANIEFIDKELEKPMQAPRGSQ